MVVGLKVYLYLVESQKLLVPIERFCMGKFRKVLKLIEFQLLPDNLSVVKSKGSFNSANKPYDGYTLQRKSNLFIFDLMYSPVEFTVLCHNALLLELTRIIQINRPLFLFSNLPDI